MKRGIAVIALMAAPMLADDVYLRGDGQITGKIIERSEESVTVDIGAGSLTVPMSGVVRIEEGKSPLHVYEERAASLVASDVDAWRELAQWASRQGLSLQAKKAYSQVVATLPDDQDANRALGRAQLDGKWVTAEESYLARGFVQFETQWMTPSERQAILAERRAREEADRQTIQAQIQATEAEQQREKETEEREEAKRDGLPQLGDPIGWGWGHGPRYWPARRVDW